MNLDRLPRRRVVVEIDVGHTRPRRYWLVLHPDEVSVCLKHPGFDADVRVVGDVSSLYCVYMGRISLAEALAEGLVEIHGPPSLVRQLPRWFAWSDFAPVVRSARRGAVATS